MVVKNDHFYFVRLDTSDEAREIVSRSVVFVLSIFAGPTYTNGEQEFVYNCRENKESTGPYKQNPKCKTLFRIFSFTRIPAVSIKHESRTLFVFTVQCQSENTNTYSTRPCTCWEQTMYMLGASFLFMIKTTTETTMMGCPADLTSSYQRFAAVVVGVGCALCRETTRHWTQGVAKDRPGCIRDT